MNKHIFRENYRPLDQAKTMRTQNDSVNQIEAERRVMTIGQDVNKITNNTSKILQTPKIISIKGNPKMTQNTDKIKIQITRHNQPYNKNSFGTM